jgi:spore coat polysaccharide biosynthesis protein SpsF
MNLVILQARMSSMRLPGKVMMQVGNKPMIMRQIDRIKQSRLVDNIVVATSIDSSDDELVEYLIQQGIDTFRGSLEDVFSRYLEIVSETTPDSVIRLTADCPLVMPELIDEMVTKFLEIKVDCLSNTIRPTFPDGLDIEIFTPQAMMRLANFDLTKAEKEHVTAGFYSRPNEFSVFNFESAEDLSNERWTVDYLEDLTFVRKVYEKFIGAESKFDLRDMLTLLSCEPSLRTAISPDRRNEKLNLISSEEKTTYV